MLRTCAGSSQARRATRTPQRKRAERALVNGASLEMTSRAPRSRASSGVDVVQVEAVDLAVDLERDAARDGRVDDRVDVELIRLALQQPAPGRVAEDVDVRVLDRAQQPIGHLLAILIERGMHRGDDEIEGGEAVVGQVERAVRPDVAFDAGEQPDAARPRRRARGCGRRGRARGARRARWPSPATGCDR